MVTKGQTSLAGAVSDLKELVVRLPPNFHHFESLSPPPLSNPTQASAKAEPESFKEDDVDLKAANDALANVDAI